MAFNKCSINGQIYGEILDPRTGEPVEITEVRLREPTVEGIMKTGKQVKFLAEVLVFFLCFYSAL
jgi:hypothetical protein